MDWLSIWGVQQAGFTFLNVIKALAKEAMEEYVKDFFKDCLSDSLQGAAPESLKRAMGKAVKEFLIIVQDELEYQDLSGAEIRDYYEIPIKRFIRDDEVKPWLGRAFDPEGRPLEAEALAAKWALLGLKTMPPDFDWEQVTKQYVRAVKAIRKQDKELRELISLSYQEAIKANVEQIAGVPPDFDLRKYQATLREKFGRLKLDALETTGSAYNALRLWNIFVPQNVRECQEFTPQLYELPKEQLTKLYEQGEIEVLLEAEAIEQHRKSYSERPIEPILSVVSGDRQVQQTVILGDPGSGKSTLLQYLALDWAEKPQSEVRGEPIPILIELRLYAQDKEKRNCHNFLSYLHQGNTACRLNQKSLDELFKSGNAIVLFDGIDEVFDPALREEVVNDIHRFSNNYPQVQMVVTSRWLGYKAETLRNAGFRHYMLQDLDREQIEHFVEQWHELTFSDETDKLRKRERLQKAVKESKPIRELAGNPLLLTMMAILNRNQELPRDRARLYEKASEVLLYQWDVEQKVLDNEQLKNWSIDARDKQAMLRKVAYHMQAGEKGLAGNVISRDELEDILINYLKTIDVEQARSVARVMIDQLRTRNFILCYLGADTYAFVHRTFLEYFCATEFVWQFEKERRIDIEFLKNELYGKHFQDEAWDEVLRLMAGIIEPQFTGSIIESLIAQNVPTFKHIRRDISFRLIGKHDILQVLNFYLLPSGLKHLILATNCLEEIRNRHDVSAVDAKLLVMLKYQVLQIHPYVLDQETAETVVGLIASLWQHQPDILSWLQSL